MDEECQEKAREFTKENIHTLAIFFSVTVLYLTAATAFTVNAYFMWGQSAGKSDSDFDGETVGNPVGGKSEGAGGMPDTKAPGVGASTF